MGCRPHEPLKCLLCEGIAIARKLCRRHYYAAKKDGSLSSFECLSPQDVFESRIQKTDTCWLWKGGRNEYGYGIFHIPGKRPVRAHRYVYEQLVGPIPEGQILLHSCDNPPCVNPAHLSPGTKRDNLIDAMVKNRRPVSERHWNAKLSSEQIQAIISDQRTHREIAKTYGISQPYVGRLKHKKRRLHEPS